MKVTVTKNLNARIGKPSVNAPSLHYLLPGSELIVDGKLYKGDLFDGIDTWMKDYAGNYYWSGALEGLGTGSNYPWWIDNASFSIPAIWRLPAQREITAAILDTGISKHVDFDFSKIRGYNYLDGSPDFQQDVFGHGTHCAGIIAAKGVKSYGVAPGTALFVAKVCDDSGIPVMTAVKNALADILNETNGAQQIRVINMSFNLPARNAAELKQRNEIEQLIARLTNEKGIIVVCSSGVTDDLGDSFPARIDSCVAVGSITERFIRSSFSRITPVLDLMAPGEGIVSSAGTDRTVARDGTSQAAAFVTGVCALALQKTNQTSVNAGIFKKFLFQTAWSDSFQPREYGHGIVQPNRLVEALNQITT